MQAASLAVDAYFLCTEIKRNLAKLVDHRMTLICFYGAPIRNERLGTFFRERVVLMTLCKGMAGTMLEYCMQI